TRPGGLATQASHRHSYVPLSMERRPILPYESGTQGRQTLDILFKFRQLIFPIHMHDQFKEIRRLTQLTGLFITLGQRITSAACPQFIVRSLGNGLASLETGNGIVIAL